MRNVLNRIKNQFSDFFFQLSWNIHQNLWYKNDHNSKNKNRIIYFSIVSAHSASRLFQTKDMQTFSLLPQKWSNFHEDTHTVGWSEKKKLWNFEEACSSNVVPGPNKHDNVIWGPLNDIFRCRRTIEKEKKLRLLVFFSINPEIIFC